MQSRGYVNVLIAEDIPSHNKGEGALFFGIAESLHTLGAVHLKIVSTNPESDRKYYSDTATVIDGRGVVPKHIATGLGSIAAKAWNYVYYFGKLIGFIVGRALLGEIVLKIYRNSFWHAILDSDLIIMGHDSAWTPLYHGPLIYLTRRIGVPVIIYGATILPARVEASGIRRKITETITCRALRAASLVTLREKLSIQALNAAGLEDLEPEVFPDLAFLMQPAGAEKVDQILEKEKVPVDKPLIGMAFSRRVLKRAFPHLQSNEDRIAAAVTALAEIIDKIVDTLGVRVIFIPHSTGPTENLDDRIIADQILAHVKHTDGVINIRGDYDPRDIKGLCGRLALSVGTRLHFAIDSTSMGVPALLIAYESDVRCRGIFEELFSEYRLLFSVENLTAKALLDALNEIWQKHHELCSYIGQTVSDARNRCLHGQKVAALFDI